jgi:hypothetical protein
MQKNKETKRKRSKTEFKKMVSFRMYPSSIKKIKKQFGSIQKWIDRKAAE